MELISLIKSVYVYTHSFSLLLLSSGQFWSSVPPPWYMHKRQNSLKAGSVKWLHSLSSNRYCSDSPCKPFSEMSACCLTARALQSFVWSKTGATTSMERDHTERNSPWWALGKAKLRQRFPKGRIDSLYGLGSRDPCHAFLHVCQQTWGRHLFHLCSFHRTCGDKHQLTEVLCWWQWALRFLQPQMRIFYA